MAEHRTPPKVRLEAFSSARVPAILAGCRDWEELAAYGAPYWRPRSEAELRRKIESQAGPGLAPEYNFVVLVDITVETMYHPGQEHNGQRAQPAWPTAKAASRIVGEVSIHAIDYRNRVGQVGVAIWNPADRGRGYGRAAAVAVSSWATGYLGLHRLEAWVVVGNTASSRLFDSLKWEHEGTLRARYFCDGFRDVDVFARVPEVARSP